MKDKGRVHIQFNLRKNFLKIRAVFHPLILSLPSVSTDYVSGSVLSTGDREEISHSFGL